MIINGDPYPEGPELLRRLQGASDEKTEILDTRNLFPPDDLPWALRLMRAIARCSECEKYLLHVVMRPYPGERLSNERWLEAVDRYAAAFGMDEENHQAVIMLRHRPDGDVHCHVLFNRVNMETFRAVDLWQNYAKHKQLARQMEIDWGLHRISSEKNTRQDYSRTGRRELHQAKRSGEDLAAIRARIRLAWETSETGAGFIDALAEQGFQLVRGDRRNFVAVDRHGHAYTIGRRATGAAAAEIKAKLADLDPDDFLDVRGTGFRRAV